MLSLYERTMQFRQAKQDIKDALDFKGISVPDDAPFSDYPEYVDRIGSGFSKHGEHVVYFSWIDQFTGQPKYWRREVIAGQTIPPSSYPAGFTNNIRENITHNPPLTFTRISGNVDQLNSGIYEDLIIQAEYRPPDNASFYLRFKTTDSLAFPHFSCKIVSVASPATALISIDNEAPFLSIPIDINNIGQPIDFLIAESSTVEFTPGEHLLRISVEYDMPYGNYVSFILGGDTDSGFRSSSMYYSNDNNKRSLEDSFYASQVQAIYFPYRDNGINNRPPSGQFESNSVNNLTALTTVVLADNMYMNGNRLFAYSQSLIYMSEINDVYLWGSDISINQQMFSNTSAKFLQIKKLNYLGASFLSFSEDIEVLAKNIEVNAFHRDSMFQNCRKLRNLPNFVGVWDDIHIPEANSFAEGCKSIVYFPDYEFSGIGNNFFSDCISIREVFSLQSEAYSIGKNFFRGCLSLKTLEFDFPNIEVIAENFLMGCNALEKISELPNSVISIGNSFCRDCRSLQDIGSIPLSLAMVGTNFMLNCTSLTTLHPFPKGVAHINFGFMGSCISLKTIHLNNIPESKFDGQQGEVENFYNCHGLECIYVPQDERANYINKFGGSVPVMLFSEAESPVTHKVLFSWLIYDPDYVEARWMPPIKHMTKLETVYHGDQCPYPKTWPKVITGEIAINLTKYNPNIFFTYVSGMVEQLSTGVVQDLVIQIEYGHSTPPVHQELHSWHSYFTIDNARTPSRSKKNEQYQGEFMQWNPTIQVYMNISEDNQYYEGKSYFYNARSWGIKVSKYSCDFTKIMLGPKAFNWRDYVGSSDGKYVPVVGSAAGRKIEGRTTHYAFKQYAVNTWTKQNAKRGPVIIAFKLWIFRDEKESGEIRGDDDMAGKIIYGYEKYSKDTSYAANSFFEELKGSYDPGSFLMCAYIGLECDEIRHDFMSFIACPIVIMTHRNITDYDEHTKSFNWTKSIYGDNFHRMGASYVPSMDMKDCTFDCNKIYSACTSLTYVPELKNIDNLGNDFGYRELVPAQTNLYYNNGINMVAPMTGILNIGDNFLRENRFVTDMHALPDGLLSIGKYFMMGCNKIRRVWIPESVTSIGAGFLVSCPYLEIIHLPLDADVLSGESFRECPQLFHIYVPSGQVQNYIDKFSFVDENVFEVEPS